MSRVINVPIMSARTTVDTTVNQGVFGLSPNQCGELSAPGYDRHDENKNCTHRISYRESAQERAPCEKPLSAGSTMLSATLMISDIQRLSITSNLVNFFISISPISDSGTRI